ETLLHLDDLLLLHVEPLREKLRAGREAFRFELVLLLLQIKEELPLRLRRAELYQAPIVHDVTNDVRADPPYGVRREAHAAVRIEVLHRLHEADVALLDEIEERAERPLVLARDHDDE